jgi:hypothetical protein
VSFTRSSQAIAFIGRALVGQHTPIDFQHGRFEAAEYSVTITGKLLWRAWSEITVSPAVDVLFDDLPVQLHLPPAHSFCVR